MGKEERIKKLVKQIGKLLSLLAIGFIVYKFSQIDFNYKEVINGTNILICIGLLLLQVFVIVTACFPWMNFVEILTDKKVGFTKAMVVFTKANIFKYVPGNVFQYVARNELAIVSKVSHFDVVMATILDTTLSLIVAFVLALVCLRESAIEYINNSGIANKKMLLILLIGLIIIIIISIILCRKFFRNKFRLYIGRFNARNAARLLKIFAYYIFNNVINCVIFYIIVAVIFQENNSVDMVYRLLGSFVFSLIIGMITPGASGGIGIRESVMLFITEGAFDSDVIISSMVLLRIISIVGDIAAFFVGKVFYLVKKRIYGLEIKDYGKN